MLMLKIFTPLIMLVGILTFLFLNSGKSWKNMSAEMSSFECGFSSYFYSRFSFSIHFFMVGMIFLFLDLELCFIMPFMSGSLSSMNSIVSMSVFILILLLGLMLEWRNNKLNWSY